MVAAVLLVASFVRSLRTQTQNSTTEALFLLCVQSVFGMLWAQSSTERRNDRQQVARIAIMVEPRVVVPSGKSKIQYDTIPGAESRHTHVAACALFGGGLVRMLQLCVSVCVHISVVVVVWCPGVTVSSPRLCLGAFKLHGRACAFMQMDCGKRCRCHLYSKHTRAHFYAHARGGQPPRKRCLSGTHSTALYGTLYTDTRPTHND